jgi:GT2 family glycosyltransferase
LVRDKEVEIGSLQETLNHIYSSHGWKGLLACCRLIDKILPISSKRWEAVKFVWNFFGTISANMRLIRKKIFSKNRHNPLGPYQKRYEEWLNENKITDRVRTLIRSDIAHFVSKPKFSIVMPVYNAPIRFLREATDSVRNQIYGNWELCICDDGSNAEIINELKKYALLDERIKVVRSTINLGISEATNQALALASGEFVGLMDHDDLLSEIALYYVAKAIDDDPSIDIIYTDKDHVTENGRRTDPYFKPDWSPHTILSHNYMIHFLVFRKSLLNEVGQLRKEFDGAQDYDLILRLVEKTERIRHIPKVLYSWRRHSGSASLVPKPPAYERARLAVQDAVNRRGDSAVVEKVGFCGPYKVSYTLRKCPTVSIIISTRDDLTFLERCWSSLVEKSTYNNYEIVIATNTLNNNILRKFCEQNGCKLVEEEDGFFSKMNNSAVAVAQGEYIIFLNDDTEIVTPHWIEQMLPLCQQRDVAAVGPKLIYPNGRIQFTRMVLGIKRDGMPYFFDPFATYDTSIFFGFSSEVISDVTAVSGACMMVRRSDFLRIGGFDYELFNLNFQDVDLCLRFREKGYSVLYTPYPVVTHYGASTKKKNPSIFRKDVEAANVFFRKYRDLLVRGDPFYNSNLSDVQGFIKAPHFPGMEPIEISSRYYDDQYWEYYGFPLRPKGDFIGNRDATVQPFLPFVSKVLNITRCQKIIDVGCGPGMLVEAFERLGVEAWGIECSREAIEYAPLTARDKIFHGDICSPEVIAKLSSQRPFAAAICIEVLEHVPMERLHEAVRNISMLSDTIIVTTPQPNLWDRDDKTHVCVMPRSFWMDLFKRAGYVEDTQKGKNIFGHNYELNQDTNMFVFLRTK